jgi:hypothetical protein
MTPFTRNILAFAVVIGFAMPAVAGQQDRQRPGESATGRRDAGAGIADGREVPAALRLADSGRSAPAASQRCREPGEGSFMSACDDQVARSPSRRSPRARSFFRKGCSASSAASVVESSGTRSKFYTDPSELSVPRPS